MPFVNSDKYVKTGCFFLIPGYRPPWRYAPVSEIYSYIPGLRPEPPPPEKTFTVHLHCILAASVSNLTTPRPAPRRTRSVSPRPSSSRKLFSPSPSTPKSSRNIPPSRPKTAIGVPSEFSRKTLVPQIKVNGSFRPIKKRAGSDKPVPIRPKAGSDTPVAIRARPKPSEAKKVSLLNSSSDDSDSENPQGRHGYYIYIYNEKMNQSQGPNEGKPTASVRPMMFSKPDIQTDDMDPANKLDLKPLSLNLTPVDSLETVVS